MTDIFDLALKVAEINNMVNKYAGRIADKIAGKPPRAYNANEWRAAEI